MEIIILILLCVVIVCLIVLLMQNKSKEVETSSADSLILQKNFEYLLKQVQDVQKNQATSKVSLNQMEEYLYRMNMVMTNTKLRGNWGEYQLDMLLSVYCGQNPSIYSMQYTLPNGKIADCAFHLPDTNKVLCIDSKFPMENYMNLQEDMDTYLRPFKMNMKKHIDDVANKYINMDTMPYALLFVPSEAIYQFVCAKCDDLFTYALQKHVISNYTCSGSDDFTIKYKGFLSHKPYGRNRTKYFVAAGGCESSCRKKCKGRKNVGNFGNTIPCGFYFCTKIIKSND